MGTTTQISVEEYLKSHSDSRCEYVDGVSIQKPMSTWMHAMLQVWISALIMRRYPSFAAGGEVHAHLRANEYRLPDIAVQLRSIVEHESYAEQPPVLCVEILSPDDRLGATFAECERYHDWGVPVCWVIDPVKRRAWSYERGAEPTIQEKVLRAGEIELALPEVFSILDGRLHSRLPASA